MDKYTPVLTGTTNGIEATQPPNLVSHPEPKSRSRLCVRLVEDAFNVGVVQSGLHRVFDLDMSAISRPTRALDSHITCMALRPPHAIS
jgi:hypothetical protein